MVGLYHKRRAQRSHSKVLGFFTKALMTLGLMVVIAFVLIVLFFNGSQIKKPLSSYLSAQTGFEVTIGDAEFSPLYPDVIKLYDVRFGNSKIGELYLEYDLRSALSDERLEINDLYLNGLTITPEDIHQLKAQRLGYHSIYASLVRFHHTPVQTTFLHAQDTTIRLNAVGFDPEHGLTFRSGALAATQAQLFAREVKDLSLQFEHQGEGLTIKNFSAAMLGGMVSGTGHYLPHEPTAQRANTNGLSSTAGLSSAEGLSSNGAADLIFDELNLSKIILHDTLRPSAGINLKATKVNLSQVVYTNDAPAPTASDDSASKALAASASKAATDNQSDAADKATAAADSSSPRADGSSAYHSMVMQGISGQLYDLKLSHNEFSARFEGEIDALSFPNLQTSFEHNKGSANLSRDLVSFDFKGQLYEGNYELTGSLDPAAQELTVEALKLERAKLALNPPRLDFLTHANSYTLKLKQAQFTNLEFLSFLNQFPVSIQSISGTAHDLVWAGATQKPSTPTPATLLYPIRAEHGALKLKLDNLLYSNLLFSEIAFEGELSSQQLQFKLPQVTMQESNWSAQGALSLTDIGQSSLTVTADNFESADLNSNLIGHMLTGKVNLSAQLTSSFEGWNQVMGDTLAATTEDVGHTKAKPLSLSGALLRNLNGSVRLGSEGLLISDFGLDLINGGKQQDYTLSGTELLAALQGSVAGINALEADTTFQAGKLSTRGRVGLATANASFSVNIDLLDHDFSGNAFMVSLGNDSTTTVSFDGTTAEPQFAIRALKRGANRPGLYLPQYDAMAQAKEQTDAKGVLNGTIAVEEPSTQPEHISERTVDNAASTATAPEANEEAEQAAAESAHAEAATTSSAESAAESTTDEGTAESATEPAADAGGAEANKEEEQAADTGASAASAAPDAEAQAPAEPEANTPATAETNQPENAHAEDSATSTAESAAEPTTDEGTSESAAEPAADAGGAKANKEDEQAADTGASAASAAPDAEAQAPNETEANTPATAETNTPESVHAEDAATSTAESAAEPATDESVAEANEEEEQAPTSDARAASTAAPTEEAQAPNETEANNPAAAETNTTDTAHAEAATPSTAESGAAPAADAGVAETNESTEQSADTGARAASAAAPTEEAQAPNETEANNLATAETNTPDNAHAEAAAPSSAESGAEPATDAGAAEAAERAAQAQADATEYELLKDVFIDSFIQHEHGTAAEEEAANAAAKKQRAEHPYDPEEELIF